MRQLTIIIWVLVLPMTAFSQADCNCAATFTWVQKMLKENYAGYFDKVPADRAAAFATHTEQFTTRIDTITNLDRCHTALVEWADWFQDGHIQLGYNAPDASPTEIRARFADWPSRELTYDSAKAILDDLPNRHPVEGIWQSDAGSYQIAILRPAEAAANDRLYLAHIIQADSVWWMPGQVKMELREGDTNAFAVNYYMLDHSLREEKARVSDNGQLRVTGLGGWYQTYPFQAEPLTEEDDKMYTLEKLNDETLVLTIPTFNERYRKEMKQLVKDNRNWMEQTPNWIIDCRGNGGGSDITYYPLRPYLTTGAVTFDGMQTRATVTNADKYELLSQDKSFGWLTRRWAKARARKLRKNAGQFIGGEKCIYKEKFKRRAMPQRVAVLIDDGCASSCEQFALFVDQSEKVTLMGQSSGGILDYGNLTIVEAPCQPFQLAYATTRSCRIDEGRGIDNIGVAPDVPIAEEEDDWVQVAAQYLQDIQGQ